MSDRVVHHLDGDPANNHLGNLEVRTLRRCPDDDTVMVQDTPHGAWLCPTCEQFFTEAMLANAAG